MLIFMIIVIIIGLILLFFFAKKTDPTQDNFDYSQPYSSTTSSCDSSQNNDFRRSDECSLKDDSGSDSSSCDSSSNND